MSKSDYLLLLPIGWAIVATGIGLLLYKSSSALIQQKDKTRTLRFTGSAAIAALAFFGLRWASHQLMDLVPVDNMIEIQNTAKNLDRKLLEVQACAATLADDACQQKVREAKEQSGSLAEMVSKLK